MSAPVTAEELASVDASLVPLLARDLRVARASIRGLIEALNETQTDRAAIADRNLDLARELETLRAAVRAHRAAARSMGKLHPRRDLDLWAAAKT